MAGGARSPYRVGLGSRSPIVAPGDGASQQLLRRSLGLYAAWCRDGLLTVCPVLLRLQDCGFARHTLTRCCRNWAAGENRSNNSRTHSYSKTELWLQQQTVRIQPMGPLTEILGDAAGRSCPVSVSVLRFVTLSNSAAAAVIPILLHLRLHEADAAAAVLATKGEYLVAPCIQLAAAAAVAAGGTGDLTTLSPTLGTAASNDSAESNSRCCCSDIDGWQQKRGSLISGRRLFSLERQIIRCALALLSLHYEKTCAGAAGAAFPSALSRTRLQVVVWHRISVCSGFGGSAKLMTGAVAAAVVCQEPSKAPYGGAAAGEAKA